MIHSSKKYLMSAKAESDGPNSMDGNTGIVGDNDIFVTVLNVRVLYEPVSLCEKVSTGTRVSTYVRSNMVLRFTGP